MYADHVRFDSATYTDALSIYTQVILQKRIVRAKKMISLVRVAAEAAVKILRKRGREGGRGGS